MKKGLLTIIKSNNLAVLIILVPLTTTIVFAAENNSENKIIDKKPFEPPKVYGAFVLSALIIGVITLVTSRIVTHARSNMLKKESSNDEKYCGSFWDIIREGDLYPSLARLQFLVWTLAVSFVAVSVFFVRSFGGVPSFPVGDFIPQTLLGLMGISTATPVIGNVLSRLRYDSTWSNTYPFKKNVPRFVTMLFEGNKPTLGRYQMFLWTWISVIFFLFIFFNGIFVVLDEIKIANNDETIKVNPLRKLTVPDINPMLVLLMGLSQGGYLTAKLAARRPLQITRFVLVKDQNIQKLTSIYGHRFGEIPGKVKLDENFLSTSALGKWSNTRIDLEVPVEFTKNNKITIITDDGLYVSEEYDEKLVL